MVNPKRTKSRLSDLSRHRPWPGLADRFAWAAAASPNFWPEPAPAVLMADGGGSDQPPRRRVQAERRRPARPAPAGQRQRAEAPQRRQRGGSTPPSGGAGGPSGTPFSPGGTRGRLSPTMMLIIFGIVVLVAIFGGPNLLQDTEQSDGVPDIGQSENPPGNIFEPAAESEQPLNQPAAALPVPEAPEITIATRTPRPSTGTISGQTWLVMLYQDADDKILEQDIYIDLNEAELIGSSDRVQIVTQIDRFRGGYRGDDDWTDTRRFYIRQDNDLSRLRSEAVDNLGEANMADGGTLVDFVTWAMATYPADRYVLILSDHGMGWPGGWSDPDPGGVGDRSIPLASALGEQLYLQELDEALGEIRARTGLDKFELIGMDACLMAQIEVFSALAPHAHYAVASQETEPALGWAYTSFLQALNENPDVDGGELGRLIVESYIQEDQRIRDDQARADFLRQGSPMGGLFGMLSSPSADQIARQLEDSITLTAIDLEAMPSLVNSVNDLATALATIDQAPVAQARTYAQSFTSIFGANVPASYIDLGNFAQLLIRQSGSEAVSAASDQVLAALGKAIIAEKHGPKKPGASGVSIYFPNSQLYSMPVAGAQSYTAVARRFASESLWDDFLAFHYTGRPFEPGRNEIAIPAAGSGVRGPGRGTIQLSPITLSDRVAAPGQPIDLSVDISGENVGYVYLLVGFIDQTANSINIADTDYLASPDTREVDGVFFPDWGSGDFTMDFQWEPLMFAITDGVDTVQALLSPQTYGAAAENAVYTVEGIYTFADGSEDRYARLYFSNGVMRQVFGFTGENGTGAPREIIPQTGDQFTVLEKWLDLDQNDQVIETVFQPGGSLTFRDQPFTWLELDAAAGDYIVGFIVEDLDGQTYPVYETVTVQ